MDSVLASRANRDGVKFVFMGWNARLVASGLANAAVCNDRPNELQSIVSAPNAIPNSAANDCLLTS